MSAGGCRASERLTTGTAPPRTHTHTRVLEPTNAGLSVAGEHIAARTLTAEGSGLIVANGIGSTNLRVFPALVDIWQ